MVKAFLTPGKRISLCRFDLSHKRGEVLYPGLVFIARVAVFAICPNRVPEEKVYGAGVRL